MIKVHHSPLLASKMSIRSDDKSSTLTKLLINEIAQGKSAASLSLDRYLLPISKDLGVPLNHLGSINVPMMLAAIEENIWQKMFENINDPAFLKEDTVLLKKLMNAIWPKLDRHPPQDLLRVLIDKSGFGWEAKLRNLIDLKTISKDNIKKIIEGDLKGLISKMLPVKGEKENFLNRIESTIKSIQLLNLHGIDEERKIFLPLPLQLSDGFSTVAQLLIHLPPKQSDEHVKKKIDKKTFRVTFLLELTEIGPLRVDLKIQGKEISGSFFLAKNESKLLVEENLPSLIANLKGKGYLIGSVECYLKDSEIVKQSLVKEIYPEEGHSVSLFA